MIRCQCDSSSTTDISHCILQICKKGVGALEQAGHEGVGNHDEPAALSLNGEKEDGGEGDLRGKMFASVIFPAEMNVDKDNGDIDGGDIDKRRKTRRKMPL